MTAVARPALLPLVPLYRLGLSLRELRLRLRLEKIRRLERPVVSIGSLSAGGAGKTPLTVALAQTLLRRGLQVDVLSRGYGRRSSAPARVNPAGEAEDFGDEPLLIARETGAPVYVAAQRYEAGLLAEAQSGGAPVIHLLDDGFQHRQLYRDVNILLLDEKDLSAEKLLPAGNLREPLAAMRRATVVAIPAGDGAASLESRLHAQGWQGPVWRIWRLVEAPLIEGSVLAFCGIARPAQFFAGLKSARLQVARQLAFPDHYRYTARDLERIGLEMRAAGATAVVTTEKDRVRLGGMAANFPAEAPLHTAKLRVEIEDEDAAITWLQKRITEAAARP
ncbi:MAG TPA: tetraacyldisaccharide 4'-kinase [Terracidiphilus sp.]